MAYTKLKYLFLRSGKRIPSIDKMKAILAKAGATVVAMKIWEVLGESKFVRS